MTPMEELREQAAKIAEDAPVNPSGRVLANYIAAAIRNMPLSASVALPQVGRMPLPNMFDPKYDDAIDWVTENCMAIRRDNGDLDYSFGAMIAAYEAGKASTTPTEIPTAAAPDDGLMGRSETIESMIAWGDETFGPCEPSRAVSRASEEWCEMVAEVPGTMQHAIEAADVIICLLRIPLIRKAINEKMAKNRARRWKLMGDGTGYHIKDAALSTATGDEAQQGEG